MGAGRLLDSEKLMVYQGEFRQGKKEGRGRLETYNSNFALGSYRINEMGISPDQYEKTIKELIAKVKQDVLQEIHHCKRDAEKLGYHNPSGEIKFNVAELSLQFVT
jgi:hypothetical protein